MLSTQIDGFGVRYLIHDDASDAHQALDNIKFFIDPELN